MPRETSVTGRITATGPDTITVTDQGRDTTVDIRPAYGSYYQDPAVGDIVHVTGEQRHSGPDIDAYEITDVER